jgi:AraC-like DNA-binding protein
MTGLNKPAAAPIRWYLWEGGFLAVGRGSEVPEHAHHAIQMCIALEGEIAVRTGGEPWREGRGVVVRADVEHSFDGRDALGAMLFVDPESAEGAWLQTTLTAPITLLPDARVQACIEALRTFHERPLEAMDVGDLIRHCVRAACAGAPPMRQLDPRIAKVLDAIRGADDLRMSLESAAARVHLSPGRFAHLFAAELGLPFRRYMLWRKLTRAMLAIGREPTLAAAAHSADFSDAAHLTRTFSQMFGLAPSVMMRGEFFVVPPPFTTSATRAA